MPRKLAPWLLLLALASPAFAGSICGVVRDASTQAPVPNAGVFAYEGGVYVGYYAATDIGGSYCIADIPDGLYDLAVRVDNYQIAWVGGILVDSVTNVDIPASLVVGLDAPWPNPAAQGVYLQYRLTRPSPMQLEVFDMRGRRVHGWAGVGQPGDAPLFWDFHDRAGDAVSSGSYFVRLTVDGQTVTRTLQRIQ